LDVATPGADKGLATECFHGAGFVLNERLYEPKVTDFPLNWDERREEEATLSLPNKMLE
jgi:hypothetical protein